MRLRGENPLWLVAQCAVVLAGDRPAGSGPQASCSAYSYAFETEFDHTRREVISFHWDSHAEPPLRRFPHLHVGSLVTSASPFRGGDFNKLHIPTGILSLEAVLLFAIEELGVEPAQGRDRAAVLSLLREGDRLASQGNAGFDR